MGTHSLLLRDELSIGDSAEDRQWIQSGKTKNIHRELWTVNSGQWTAVTRQEAGEKSNRLHYQAF